MQRTCACASRTNNDDDERKEERTISNETREPGIRRIPIVPQTKEKRARAREREKEKGLTARLSAIHRGTFHCTGTGCNWPARSAHRGSAIQRYEEKFYENAYKMRDRQCVITTHIYTSR